MELSQRLLSGSSTRLTGCTANILKTRKMLFTPWLLLAPNLSNNQDTEYFDWILDQAAPRMKICEFCYNDGMCSQNFELHGVSMISSVRVIGFRATWLWLMNSRVTGKKDRWQMFGGLLVNSQAKHWALSAEGLMFRYARNLASTIGNIFLHKMDHQVDAALCLATWSPDFRLRPLVWSLLSRSCLNQQLSLWPQVTSNDWREVCGSNNFAKLCHPGACRWKSGDSYYFLRGIYVVHGLALELAAWYLAPRNYMLFCLNSSQTFVLTTRHHWLGKPAWGIKSTRATKKKDVQGSEWLTVWIRLARPTTRSFGNEETGSRNGTMPVDTAAESQELTQWYNSTWLAIGFERAGNRMASVFWTWQMLFIAHITHVWIQRSPEWLMLKTLTWCNSVTRRRQCASKQVTPGHVCAHGLARCKETHQPLTCFWKCTIRKSTFGMQQCHKFLYKTPSAILLWTFPWQLTQMMCQKFLNVMEQMILFTKWCFSMTSLMRISRQWAWPKTTTSRSTSHSLQGKEPTCSTTNMFWNIKMLYQANADAVPGISVADNTIWTMWKRNWKPDTVLPESVGRLLENYGHEAGCRAVRSASYLLELWSLRCYQVWKLWYYPRRNSDVSTVSFSRMEENSCEAQHAKKKCWTVPSSSKLLLLDRSGNTFALFHVKLSSAYEDWDGYSSWFVVQYFTAMCWQHCLANSLQTLRRCLPSPSILTLGPSNFTTMCRHWVNSIQEFVSFHSYKAIFPNCFLSSKQIFYMWMFQNFVQNTFPFPCHRLAGCLKLTLNRQMWNLWMTICHMNVNACLMMIQFVVANLQPYSNWQLMSEGLKLGTMGQFHSAFHGVGSCIVISAQQESMSKKLCSRRSVGDVAAHTHSHPKFHLLLSVPFAHWSLALWMSCMITLHNILLDHGGMSTNSLLAQV